MVATDELLGPNISHSCLSIILLFADILDMYSHEIEDMDECVWTASNLIVHIFSCFHK